MHTILTHSFNCSIYSNVFFHKIRLLQCVFKAFLISEHNYFVCTVFSTIFFSSYYNSHELEQKLDLQPLSQQGLRNRYQLKKLYQVSLRSLLVFLFLSSWDLWFVNQFSVRSREPTKKGERKTGDYISTVPLEQLQSFFCPAASAQTSSQQTDPSMFRNHNAAHCMLFVYLNPGPLFPWLCHHLYPKTDRAWK